MKNLLIIALFQLAALQLMAGNGSISGMAKDSLTDQPLVGAFVVAQVNGKAIKGMQTDIDGYYTLSELPAGNYDVQVSYIGYNKVIYTNIRVYTDQITSLNASLSNAIGPMVVVKGKREQKIAFDPGDPVTRFSGTEIDKSIDKPEKIASQTVGAYQQDRNQPVTFRGSRVGTTLYMVDGMRIVGEPNLPLGATDEVLVISQGIPAKYGDTVGGVVVINTKSFSFY